MIRGTQDGWDWTPRPDDEDAQRGYGDLTRVLHALRGLARETGIDQGSQDASGILTVMTVSGLTSATAACRLLQLCAMSPASSAG